MDKSTIRVLALIYPIEKHVGHWACSSSLLTIKRIIMSGENLEEQVVDEIREFKPEVIAVCGKAAIAYLDLLDDLTEQLPDIAEIPRVFKMQNSSLLLQSPETMTSKKLCRDLSLWFKLACDPRWSWIFVQTLNDVSLIRRHLAPVPVSACPYGYDPAVFNPDLPELKRIVDVGIYMNLRDDPGRKELVARTQEICQRRGWSFDFVEGVYWHAYAKQIRNSKIALHRSIHSEVPFRIYETTVFGTVFVTDPLKAHIEDLFVEDLEYLTYQRDFSNLETVLEKLLIHRDFRQNIGKNGQQRARQYAWPMIADKYIAPVLEKLLQRSSMRLNQG